MIYDTITKQESNRESIEPIESDGVRIKKIRQLPGYNSLQERFQSPPSNQEPTKDRIFNLLRHQRRRYALKYLDVQTGVVRIGDLADALANWESEDEDTYISYKERKRAYVSLYQTHSLP